MQEGYEIANSLESGDENASFQRDGPLFSQDESISMSENVKPGTLRFARSKVGLRLASGAAAAAALLVSLPMIADAQPAPVLVNHRAIYDLSLAKSRNEQTVETARGRLAYGFSADGCEGYTTEYRQVSEVGGGRGQPVTMDLKSTSVEDIDGKWLRFKTESRSVSGEVSVVEGVARKRASGIDIELTVPAKKTLKLDGDIVFPTEQVVRIIEAAKSGKSLLELSVYDGSDEGDKLYRTLTVIGAPIAAGNKPDDADAGAASEGLRKAVRWPVTVSYYDASAPSAAGEQTPTYAMSFQLFENGVSRALKLDFNDFVLAGKMSTFEERPAKPCKK